MLDSAELMLLAEELQEALEGSKIQKIVGARPDRFVFTCYRHDAKRSLLIALEQDFPRVHLSTAPEPTAERLLDPIPHLRGHLLNARIESIRSLPGERILDISLGVLLNDKPAVRHLVIELFPSSRNLLLCDAAHGIIFCLREGGLKRPDIRNGGDWRVPKAMRDRSFTPATPFAFLGQPVAAGALSSTIEAWATPREDEARTKRLRDALLVELRRRDKKEEKLREHLAEDVARGSASESLRLDAEALKPCLDRIQRGMTEITVPDWTSGSETMRTVKLDPRLPPAHNLDRIFKDAKKLAETWARASAELGRVEERLASIRNLVERIQGAQDAAALEELRAEAVEAHWITKPPDAVPPGTHRARSQKREPETRLPYKTFTSIDGFTILVGRTAADNDELTFKVARGGDIWLHVGDYAGSHVVIRMTDKVEVTEAALFDAAALAVHFSQAPKGSRPAVSWTRAKFVKKFKGASKGQVQLAERRTLKPRGEPERLQRLLGKR